MQVRIEPLVLPDEHEVPHLERPSEAPEQFVDDGGDHIAVHQGVGIGLEPVVQGDLEVRSGDLVAFGDQLLFDVARETGADGEDRFAAVDVEAWPESGLGQGDQALSLRLSRPRPAGILVTDTLERVRSCDHQKGHERPISLFPDTRNARSSEAHPPATILIPARALQRLPADAI